MRSLLDASSQRIITIIETLAGCEGWTNLADLSTSVKASERTVSEDISKLRKHWGQDLNIEVSKKNGVILRNRNSASIGIVFMNIFNDSVALRWIKELLFHPGHGMEFYLNRLFVSRSTLIRLLPRINRFLSGKGMTIQSLSNSYQLLGKDEQYLRNFCASFLLELYGLDFQSITLTLIRRP